MHYLTIRKYGTPDGGPGRGVYVRDYSNKYTFEVNGCWLWKGYIESNGYGSRLAHKRVYQALREKVPKGMQLDHLCRNLKCVNPDHLEIVTPAENTRRSNVAKLNMGKVEEIRELAKTMKQVEIARMFGVYPSTISRIVNYKRWEVAPFPA